jgi:predicted metal-dependent hydrolase
MKTAMMTLIHNLLDYEGQMISCDQVMLKARKLIETEKDQIYKAYEAGISEFDTPNDGLDYYQNTFDPKKKSALIDAAKPLIRFLSENHHPHIKAIVDSSNVELLEALEYMTTKQFIKD